MISPAAKVRVCAVVLCTPWVCAVVEQVSVDPVLVVPSNTLTVGAVVQEPAFSVSLTQLSCVKWPALVALWVAITLAVGYGVLLPKVLDPALISNSVEIQDPTPAVVADHTWPLVVGAA